MKVLGDSFMPSNTSEILGRWSMKQNFLSVGRLDSIHFKVVDY